MENITLKWEKVVTLKDSCFEFLFPGIYFHLLESKGTKRIIYIGRSDNISFRQYEYYSSYYYCNKLSKYSYYNIGMVSEEPNYYTCTKHYEESKKIGFIIPGGSQPENFTENEVFDLRKEYADRIYVTAARFDNLELQKEVETMLQIYFIGMYKMDAYYGKCFPIGYTGRKLRSLIEKLNNSILPINIDWLLDLPETIMSEELKSI